MIGPATLHEPTDVLICREWLGRQLRNRELVRSRNRSRFGPAAFTVPVEPSLGRRCVSLAQKGLCVAA
jgi:hypothetical protein